MVDWINGLLLVVFFLFLLYVSWRSTEVREIGLIAATTTRSPFGQREVVVPVRGNLLNRLVDQIQSSNLRNRRRGRAVQTQRQNDSVEEIEYNEGNILMTHVLSWASNDSVSQGTNTESEEARLQRQTEYLIDGIVNEGGPEAIIHEMDRDLEPENFLGAAPAGAEEEEAQNYTNENSENVNKQTEEEGETPQEATNEPVEDSSDPWKIKIKYLNDDVKIVEAPPSQTLGEFKRRNFAVELAANKLVRLVFNGKILQPDGSSLRNCGLFENCVVHCLVHNLQAMATSGVSNSDSPRERLAVVPRPPQQVELADLIYPRAADVISGGGSVAGGGLLAENNERREGNVEGSQEAVDDSSSRNLIWTRTVQWLSQQWESVYNWRFFTEMLMLIFSILVFYLWMRYAEFFTATANVGLVLLSVIVLGWTIGLSVTVEVQ